MTRHVRPEDHAPDDGRPGSHDARVARGSIGGTRTIGAGRDTAITRARRRVRGRSGTGAGAPRRTRVGPALLLLPPLLLAGPWTTTAAQAPAQAGLVLEDCQLTDALGLRSRAARCGTLHRPEDPQRPDGPQVPLHVAVIPALTPSPADDALTVIAGGPGGASTDFYVSFAAAFERIRRKRDIVLVDQRGTGASNALDCPFESLEAGDTDPDAVRRLARDCLASLARDPRFYTTSLAVDDLDAVREALGYAALDVYGASYGTRVALHYLRQHPARARTVILDGVVPAQIPLTPEIALDAQAALERIFARCEASSDCARAFPDLRGRFANVMARLRAGPVAVELAHPVTAEPTQVEVTADHLRAAVRLLSYASYSVSVIPLMISQAAEGNFVPLAAQAEMTVTSLAQSLSYGMHNAVVCTEDAPFIDDFLAREVGPEALDRTYLGPDMVRMTEAMCSVWPRGVMDADLKEPVVSDAPVLLLSGEADPVTPPRNAERAIGPDGRYLSNARHIVVPGQGHGVADKGCLPALLGEFVEAASHGGLDPRCLERLGPAAFFLDFTSTAP